MNETPSPRTRLPISTRVVQAIADTAGADPLDLEPPLFYSIDLEALDRLVSGGFSGRVRFEYGDYTVTVREDGEISVDETADSEREQ